MKYLFALIFACYFLSSCAEKGIEDSSKRNENWVWWIDSKTGEGVWIPFSNQTTVKTGDYTTFYFNGKIKLKGKLVDGKEVDTSFVFDINENLIKYEINKPDTTIQYYLLDGTYKDYFQTGGIFEEGIVKNHERGEQWTTYFKNGNVKWKLDLVNGTGWDILYFENGLIYDSLYYTKNKQDGRAKFWYENGQLKEISDWKMGVQHGLYQTFFENGNLKELTIWVDGKREGKSEMWYENGQKEHIVNKEDGLSEGDALIWYSNGNYKCKLKYQKGKKNGPFVFYHENGMIQSTAFYVNDHAEGEVKVFDSTGVFIEKQIYRDGELINVEPNKVH